VFSKQAGDFWSSFRYSAAKGWNDLLYNESVHAPDNFKDFKTVIHVLNF